jgi:hypothetical protein
MLARQIALVQRSQQLAQNRASPGHSDRETQRDDAASTAMKLHGGDPLYAH